MSAHRYLNCEIRKPLCFCAMIPQLALQTRVIILIHTCDEVLTTNTARLAAKALTPDFVSRLSWPVNLIVPDASSRQIKNFVRREPSLGVDFVCFSPVAVSL